MFFWAVLSSSFYDEANVTTTLMPDTNSTTTSSIAPIPAEEEVHQLLSMMQFSVLCLIVGVFYYAAMLFSMIAVGQSYASLRTGLVSPFSFLKTAIVEIYEAVCHPVTRVGVPLEDD